MKQVSVVIPVYNAEPYIVSCIHSLRRQTLQACEFIFVNDGSRDRSADIIEQYKQQDNRIILIQQDNRGVGAARNRGLQEASGEYIGFVDADDHVEPDMYEILYRAAKEDDCDAVISNVQSEAGGRFITTKYSFPVNVVLPRRYIEEDILPYFVKADNLNTAANKIYRRELIKKYRVTFPNGIALGEDGLFNLHFFSHARTAKYVDYTGYHYREVAGSATRNIAGKDYFSRALEVYSLELPKGCTGKLTRADVRRLKAMKLVQSVISYIHVYLAPSEEMSFRERYQYVRDMIANRHVREALALFINTNEGALGRYERFIISMIQRKSVTGLLAATTYSRIRNSRIGRS